MYRLKKEFDICFYKKMNKLPLDLKIIDKVRIDNPNIELEKNITLYPGVHILCDGKYILDNR